MQTFWPLAVDRTLIEWSTMVPDWGDGDPPELGSQRNRYYDKVMAEDTTHGAGPALAASPSCRGILTSYHERRIYHHEASIDRLIGIDRVPEHLRVPQLLPVA